MDVVIVTLLRDTLVDTIRSVKALIPDPNIVVITGDGALVSCEIGAWLNVVLV